jgi:hypothetical protein
MEEAPPVHCSSVSTYLDLNGSKSTDCTEKNSHNYIPSKNTEEWIPICTLNYPSIENG